MFVPHKFGHAALLSSLLLLAACGQKGPLIVAQPNPDKNSGNNEQHPVKLTTDNSSNQQSTEAQ